MKEMNFRFLLLCQNNFIKIKLMRSPISKKVSIVASFTKGMCKKIKLNIGPTVSPKATINPINKAAISVAIKPKKIQIIL